ncbi:ABC transporter ATP-binding protein [Devosia limi DSM 17137]|uniref:ABC transporter ATP-binding protein n=1 Tax=Devosia limi DSM 17137 TaxID=1121477 RepID=A0A0F5LQL5_9HYPH|nr:ABC transporter ATP-binding protein [Devosia limi]KKB84439.1 ABC transporter ATP-binding protein [Devosia limi DSM 17137]SHF59848.1 putative spermidine/putrescine transport system ATP-binding protein [Devosia limi DSM 17137]
MAGDIARGARLELRDLGKSYGGLKVLADVNLSVNPGEFITFLGPSGSGKTTTLNLIAGFVDPDAGGVMQLDGRDLGGVPANRRDIGVVFQNYALFPHMTVRANIAFPLRQRRPRPDADAIDRRVNEVLALVHLEALGDRFPHQLSGGQQQRVALARAVVFEPKLLLLDEPLGALDKRLREALQMELRRIHRELGVTIVFVTHDQDEALTLSDRVVVFREGAVEQIGTPEQLYDNPGSEFVATFLGDSNIFAGNVQNGVFAAPDLGGRFAALPDVADGPAKIMVRPERVSVALSDNDAILGNAVPVTISDIVFAGSSIRVEGRNALGATLIARCGNVDKALAIGNAAWFGWDADSTRLIGRSAA